MNNEYDDVVIGLGAMGSAAAYHLSKRGRRVLGLDAFHRLHANGSSHGSSRIIREAYAEAPEYVPLVRRSYALWRELEEQSGKKLLCITGGLVVGRPESGLVTGVVRSAKQHGISYEEFSSEEAMNLFPAFRLPDDLCAVFEERAGVLTPESCVAAHLDLAAHHGADLRHNEAANDWRASETGVRVDTERGTYEAGNLVVTAGPWAGEVLEELDLPLSVERIVNVHFEPSTSSLFAPDRCPVYVLDVPEGEYYGFPLLPDQGVKIGHHGGETCTPHDIRRNVDPSEVLALKDVLDKYLPGAAGATKRTLTCMYTNTPDKHFIIERHPHHGNVVYGCGFSGHGFKFASVVGEALADLTEKGETRHSIGFLSTSRFGS